MVLSLASSLLAVRPLQTKSGEQGVKGKVQHFYSVQLMGKYTEKGLPLKDADVTFFFILYLKHIYLLSHYREQVFFIFFVFALLP